MVCEPLSHAELGLSISWAQLPSAHINNLLVLISQDARFDGKKGFLFLFFFFKKWLICNYRFTGGFFFFNLSNFRFSFFSWPIFEFFEILGATQRQRFYRKIIWKYRLWLLSLKCDSLTVITLLGWPLRAMWKKCLNVMVKTLESFGMENRDR